MRSALILVGMMGAGKSAVGRAAAARLGLAFTDTDEAVEQASGRTVAAIFASEGEAAFRAWESQAVAAACRQGGVIATGGGAVLSRPNRDRLREAGLVVWLDASPAELARRLSAGSPAGGPAPERPLLAATGAAAGQGDPGPGLTERLAALLAARRPLYAAAHHRVETSGKTVAEVTEEVLRLYQDWDNSKGDKSEAGIRWVPVNLGERSYRIAVGAGLLSQAGALLRQEFASSLPTRAMIVTTAGVAEYWLKPLLTSLEAADIPAHVFLVPNGEDAKTLEVLGQTYDACIAAGLDRRSAIIALGGGTVGDLAGMVAATYLRGIDFIQVPTSLLAQADASVGGKVAVNHRQGKNLIGAFHQPRLVLADTLTLSTLPPRELRAGLAEVIKHGVIAGPDYLSLVRDRFDLLLAGAPPALAEVVAGSCRIKAGVVGADERETGPRLQLNFGHTVAHALEAAVGFDQLVHGEAVSLGMLVAARLGSQRGWAPGLEEELTDLLGRAGLPLRVPQLPVDAIMSFFRTDKKVSGKRLTWLLAREIGDVVPVQDVLLEDVRRILLDLGARP